MQTTTDKPEEKDEATKLAEQFRWLQRRSPYRKLRVIFKTPEDARNGWLKLHSKTGVEAEREGEYSVLAKCHPLFAMEMAQTALATGGKCHVPDESPRPVYPVRGSWGQKCEPWHRLSNVAAEMAAMAADIDKVSDELRKLKASIRLDYEFTPTGDVLLRIGGLALKLRYDYDRCLSSGRPDTVTEYNLTAISNIERYMELTEKLLAIVDPGETFRPKVEEDTGEDDEDDDEDSVAAT